MRFQKGALFRREIVGTLVEIIHSRHPCFLRLGKKLREFVFTEPLGLLSHDQRGEGATVGDSNKARSGMSSSKVFVTRETTCVASGEWPPRSKKLS